MRLTPRLLRRLGPRRLADERGAVAVLVAILLVPLLGFAAIAVDVASLYADREQLRNAADAAALAVATDCAQGACGNPVATATSALTANAGAADAAGATLRTPDVSVGGQTVTVTVSADQAHWFAPVLGIDSTRVTATATATWKAMSHGVAQLPLAISWCEYQRQIAKYPLTSTVSRRLDWDLGWLSLCTGPKGGVTLGGHALTGTDSSSVCRATSSVGQYIDVSIWSSVLPNRCSRAYLDSLIGNDLQIPVWDDLDGWLFGGYRAHVYGYALFHLTGYQLTYGEPVFYGYFTRAVVPASATSSTGSTPAANLGATSISLSPQG
ncbi:pilus assembly protein TadG-related protein [Modestobacter sp. VKM Ac-2979]|uniref:pilus assembly protein TadG-related protein n=1 Tax=unclassified Modestobacter TaxID=2643866 RepID=UPI0022ABC2C9|nr:MULTISPECIES: pilus assembly protein TadG-related protein [unclassified Modestobacter]MCZ2810083.1 pilus assembly protein TadG-related protein [Modestobacter sp. VKM Ac-2979]MCZ2844714.1 pilus assembly protein TadG-related protein [Modestobacter sp. VKM Ac-2980]